MIGASATPVHRSVPGNAMKADYELGQDNIRIFGLDIHNPVFAVSSPDRHRVLPTRVVVVLLLSRSI